jgi:2-oxoglutarate dehydrogenase E2 component (dihydrolipoamide succinyltransferase)
MNFLTWIRSWMILFHSLMILIHFLNQRHLSSLFELVAFSTIRPQVVGVRSYSCFQRSVLAYQYPVMGSNLFTEHRRLMAEVTFKINDFGGAETVQSGELSKWNFKEGDYVEVDDELCSIETEKIAVQPTSEHDGVIKKLLKSEGDIVNKGDELWVIDTEGKPPKEEEEPKEEPTKKKPTQTEKKDASDSKNESKSSKSETKSSKSESKSKSSSAPPKEARSAPGSETRVKMSQMRARIAQRLKESQNTAAMLTTFQECDMHELMKMRTEYKDSFMKEHGVKLGFMSCFVKAASNALLKERAVNAFIDGNEIVYKDFVDINVAVATPTGLLTPVLRDCDKMSFADVEREINHLAEKARSGQMTIPD